MSPDRNQRKQKLLIRLSESRLGVIDEAEALGKSIKKSFSWIRPVGRALTGKKAGIISLGAVVAGFLLVRGASKLIFSSHARQGGNPASGDGRHFSLFDLLKTSLLSIATASLVPAFKQVVQQTASRKISDIFAKYLSR